MQRAQVGNVEVQESVVVHREAVGIQLDEVDALVLQETIGVIVLQPAALVHADRCEV